MELQSFFERVVALGDDDDDDDLDLDETGDEGADTIDSDVVNSIICPSCGEDLNITDEDELFEGAQLVCDSCGAEMEITGFDKNTPILKQIEEQK